MKSKDHYYEAHISLMEDVRGTLSEEIVYKILKTCNFKMIDLAVIRKSDLLNEEYGTITTGQSDKLSDITTKVKELVRKLQEAEFTVTRYKIESTVIDSKFEDKLNLLYGTR